MHTELAGDWIMVPTQNKSHFNQKQVKETKVKKTHCAL